MHELTELIKSDGRHIDYVITSWLEKKAEEIKLGMIDACKPHVDSILGLDRSGEANKTMPPVACEQDYVQRAQDSAKDLVSKLPKPSVPGSDEEIVKKLDSMKNEQTKTFGSSEAALEHLKSLSVPGREQVKWCDHLTLYTTKDWAFLNGSGLDVAGWMECPICLKPRPEKRRALAEVLNKAGGWSNQVDYNLVADAAIKYFLELVDELKGNGFVVDVSDLKSELEKGGGA